MSLTYQDIQSALGEEAELLLNHQCTTIASSRLALPSPTFVDDVFRNSDRNIQTLRSLQTIYNHGRLSGTGYVSILPVDQGINAIGNASYNNLSFPCGVFWVPGYIKTPPLRRFR